VDDTPLRFEFTVPDGIDLPEAPPGGRTVVGGEPDPFLERLRAALGDDPRWIEKGVAIALPDQAHPRGPHIVVWVVPAADTDAGVVLAGVDEVVSDVIPGVTLRGTQRTWR
jgi:hypothetical protein